MNMAIALIMGAAGMASGWFIPQIALKTAGYKLKKSNAPFNMVENKKLTSPFLKLFCLLVTGTLWATIGMFAGSLLHVFLLAIVLYVASVITLVDIRIRVIPNEAVLIMLLAGLILQFSFNGFESMIYAVVTMLIVMVVFIVLGSALGLNTIGAGDVKLAGAMGLILGYPHIIYALIGMSALLLVWCAGGLITKKLSLKSMLAFAPFMMAGTVFAIVANISEY